MPTTTNDMGTVLINSHETIEVTFVEPITTNYNKSTSKLSVSESKFQNLVIELISNAMNHDIDIYELGRGIGISGNVLKGWARGEFFPISGVREATYKSLSKISFNSPLQKISKPRRHSL